MIRKVLPHAVDQTLGANILCTVSGISKSKGRLDWGWLNLIGDSGSIPLKGNESLKIGMMPKSSREGEDQSWGHCTTCSKIPGHHNHDTVE